MSIQYVTAVTPKYFWGAYLLGSSIHLLGDRTPLHVVGYNLDPEMCASLSSIPGVSCEREELPLTANPAAKMPDAILKAFRWNRAEWVVWIDADMIVTAPFLRKGELKINTLYLPFTSMPNWTGSIPSRMLERWKSDISQRSEPRFTDHRVGSELAIFHRDTMDFVEQWQSLIKRVVRPMTGKSILNDDPCYPTPEEDPLLATYLYAQEVPHLRRIDKVTFDQSLLDRGEAPIKHWRSCVKPWEGWSIRGGSYRKVTLAIVDLARWERPSLPWSLDRRYAPLHYLFFLLYSMGSGCRWVARSAKKLLFGRLRSGGQ